MKRTIEAVEGTDGIAVVDTRGERLRIKAGLSIEKSHLIRELKSKINRETRERDENVRGCS